MKKRAWGRAKSLILNLLIISLVLSPLTSIHGKTSAAPHLKRSGDLNGDNIINAADLSILVSYFGTSNTSADLNGDGKVNVLDLSILLCHYSHPKTSHNTKTQ